MASAAFAGAEALPEGSGQDAALRASAVATLTGWLPALWLFLRSRDAGLLLGLQVGGAMIWVAGWLETVSLLERPGRYGAEGAHC